MRTRTNLKIVSGKMDAVPLVDVVFLLLIFFLISSSLVFQPGIPVELPTARTSSVRAAEKIVVTITKSDAKSDLLFFNDNPVRWEDLERELRELVRRSRRVTAAREGAPEGASLRAFSPMLVLRADAGVPYAKIVEVMSLARSLELGVYLATDPEQPRGVADPRRR